jgi:hypothetical protein
MSTLFCEKNKKVFLQKCLTNSSTCDNVVPEGKRKGDQKK